MMDLLILVIAQMGSQFKSAVLEEQTASVIRQWHAEVREKRKKQNNKNTEHPRDSFSSVSRSYMNSPIDLSSHHRSLTISGSDSIHGENEIVENHLEIRTGESNPVTSSSETMQLEMPEIRQASAQNNVQIYE